MEGRSGAWTVLESEGSSDDARLRFRQIQTAGISIEHGQQNRIVANRIADAPVGVAAFLGRNPASVSPDLRQRYALDGGAWQRSGRGRR